MNRSIEALKPEIAELCRKHLYLCKVKNISIYISNTLRTAEEQTALYAQGRQSLVAVNQLRELAGMPLIGPADNSYSVTNAPVSLYHANGLAYDIVPIIYSNPTWDYKRHSQVFDIIGEIGENLGMTWGGRWKSIRDYPHFQKDK